MDFSGGGSIPLISSLFRGRLTVGQQPLKLYIGVRIPASDLDQFNCILRSKLNRDRVGALYT
jgi:hypothetical protein